MPSSGTSWAGRRKELVAGGAQGHVRTLLSCPLLSCLDVQGQSRASPSPCLLPGEEAAGADSRSAVPRAGAGSTSRCGTSYLCLAFACIFSAQLVTTKV